MRIAQSVKYAINQQIKGCSFLPRSLYFRNYT
nr:MAG TPA: hypothetical protein [Caudoviricetes sp.]